MKKTISFLFTLLLLASLPGFAFAAVDAQSVRLEDYFTARDLVGDWDKDEAQEISLSRSLTITEAGVYVLSGTIADGCISVNVGGGVYLITAEGRGISGKDSVRIFDGSYTIDCGQDPIRSRNTEKADKGYVLILGGQFFLDGNKI